MGYTEGREGERERKRERYWKAEGKDRQKRGKIHVYINKMVGVPEREKDVGKRKGGIKKRVKRETAKDGKLFQSS